MVKHQLHSLPKTKEKKFNLIIYIYAEAAV